MRLICQRSDRTREIPLHDLKAEPPHIRKRCKFRELNNLVLGVIFQHEVGELGLEVKGTSYKRAIVIEAISIHTSISSNWSSNLNPGPKGDDVDPILVVLALQRSINSSNPTISGGSLAVGRNLSTQSR